MHPKKGRRILPESPRDGEKDKEPSRHHHLSMMMVGGLSRASRWSRVIYGAGHLVTATLHQGKLVHVKVLVFSLL